MDQPFDPARFDFARPLAGPEQIRAVLPHRHEMELLSGVVHIDPAAHHVIGFLDVPAEPFWARGHFPGFPVLPGVFMCEAAAQLCCYYTQSQKIVTADQLMGLGGLEDVRFLRTVRPGERLVIEGRGEKVHRRMTKFRATGYVGTEKAFEALVVGVPLGRWEDLRGA